MIGREYFALQAATLVEFARSTNDRKLAAALIEKASNLLSQIDESSARRDPSPQAPDVEPENRVLASAQVDELGAADLSPLAPDIEPPSAT